MQSSNDEHPVAAERKPATRRRIWLCADDYGISPAVNAAIRDLALRGRINAVSVMMVAPSLERSEVISLGMLNAGAARLALGVHLTLTAPFRPLSRTFQPLRQDAFLPLGATLRAALLRRLRPGTLRIEIKDQIKAFIAAFGRAPDFVDGHQHVQLFPQIREAVLATIKDTAPQAWVRQCGRIVAPHLRFADRKALLLDALSRSFRRIAAAQGVRTNPAFAGAYAFEHKADYARLFPSFLEGLPEGSVVMCHPGRVDAELTRLDPLTTLREREFAFLSDDAFPDVLEAHGVALA